LSFSSSIAIKILISVIIKPSSITAIDITIVVSSFDFIMPISTAVNSTTKASFNEDFIVRL